jgi:hypothetical protein
MLGVVMAALNSQIMIEAWRDAVDMALEEKVKLRAFQSAMFLLG